MKILIFTPRYPPIVMGGGEISVRLLAEELAKQFEVTVLSMDGSSVEEINGVKIIRRHYNNSFWSVFSLFIYLFRTGKQFDIIHAYNMFFYHYLGVLSFFIKTPIFITLNNIPDQNSYWNGGLRANIKSLIISKIQKFFFDKVKYKIAVSEFLKDYYVKSGFKGNKIRIIPNMVDNHFHNFEQKLIHKNNNDFIIMYAGNLYKQKGVDIFISAIKECVEKMLSPKVLIVGDGPEYDSLNRLSNDLGLQTFITFLGKVKYHEMPNYYCSANLLVHPARWWESFPRTIIEAMSYGLPIIVSNVGASPEIVDEEVLIFKAESSKDLSEKIIHLYHNKKLYNEISSKLVEKAKKYLPDKILPLIIDYYIEALNIEKKQNGMDGK